MTTSKTTVAVTAAVTALYGICALVYLLTDQYWWALLWAALTAMWVWMTHIELQRYWARNEDPRTRWEDLP